MKHTGTAAASTFTVHNDGCAYMARSVVGGRIHYMAKAKACKSCRPAGWEGYEPARTEPPLNAKSIIASAHRSEGNERRLVERRVKAAFRQRVRYSDDALMSPATMQQLMDEQFASPSAEDEYFLAQEATA